MGFTKLINNRLFLIVIAIIIVIFALNFFQAPVRNFFYLISSPVQKGLWGAGDCLSDFFASLFRARVLQKEAGELYLRNLELTRENTALSALRQENKTLRQALKIGLEKEFNLVLAQGLAKEISQDFIFIDKGSKHGISKNEPIITKEKILCGRVKEVYKNFSKVELVSSKGFSFDVGLGEQAVAGAARGKGNFKVVVELLPQEIQIDEGEPVLTSAAAGIFPNDLLVGQIKRVLKSDIEPFQQAEVELACNLKSLKHLFVITDY